MKKDANKKAVHDINNLLASIVLATDLLLREIAGPVTKQQKKHLKNMLVEAKKIRDIVKKAF